MTNNNNQIDIKDKTIARLLKKGKLRGRTLSAMGLGVIRSKFVPV